MKRLLPLLVGVVCLVAVSLSAQSLADVAKQAEAQRAAAKAKGTAPKVYTNDNLVDAIAPPISQTAVKATPDAPTTAGPTIIINNVAPSQAHDEAWWKNRMRTLRAQLDSDETYLRDAIAREKPLNEQVNRSVVDILYIRDRLQLAVLQREWQTVLADIGRLRAAIVNDQRNIVNLEDEARREHAPPGWLRP